MYFASSLAFLAAALVTEVAAHGYVPLIRINGQYIPGWDITKGVLVSALVSGKSKPALQTHIPTPRFVDVYTR